MNSTDLIHTPFRIEHVTSADGTSIGYRQIGKGPPLLILHGGLIESRNYTKLALALADHYTVSIPDRRGRGLSGDNPHAYSIAQECEDLIAVLQATHAPYLFGHSAGGLIALETAMRFAGIEKLAVYEPGISVNGSFPFDWLPRFEQELCNHQTTAAMTTFLKGLRLNSLSNLPRWLIYPFAMLMTHGEDGRKMAATLPTVLREAKALQALDQQHAGAMHECYRTITAQTLVLCGERGPHFLVEAAHSLTKIIPGAQVTVMPKLDHNGPDLNGPQAVATALLRFFA